MKFTKIVCTIGPASEKPAILQKMIRAGMNVARLNFSHGTYPSHAKLITNVRAAAKACNEPIAILQDLQGPRIRIGEVADSGVQIEKGERVIVVPQSMYHERHTTKMLPNHFARMSQDVKPGQHILIADGLMDLRIVKISGPEIHCTVSVGGVVKSHKGINVPGADLKVDSITEKDREDIAFGVAHGVDFVALSFVRSAADIHLLKSILKRHAKKHPHANHIGVIAKIERPEAVSNIDEILEVVDGIMVARGDLGIEVPAQRVPIIQKELVSKALARCKPVIVATQMLESMIVNRRATRAEVSDVANAVIDHTDAVMLSGESATGLYPLETVTIMSKTIHEAEKSKYNDYVCPHIAREKSIPEMLSHAVCDILMTKRIKLVIAEAHPEVIRRVAQHRPDIRIIGFSHDATVRQQMNLVHGVTMYPHQKNITEFLKKEKLVRKGELLLVVEDDGMAIRTL